MMHNLRQPLLVTSLAFAVTAIAFTSFRSLAGQETPFRVDTTWRLGGDGSWDYLAVDTAAHLLYIARLNRIMVVATRTRQWLGEIGNLEHAHGIAFDDEGKVGYIRDGGAGNVVVFDRASRDTIARIPVGKNPDAVLFEPTRRLVFVFNGARTMRM